MRAHQLVLEWVEAQLSSGKLVLGGRLPAERALAEQLSVSRTSVREAVRILEAMGVVRAGVGSGPDAGTVVIAEPTAALASAIRLHMATQHLPVADVVQTRVLLESWAAAHAQPDSPGLAEAEELLEGMRATADTGAFLDLDVRFHLALAKAADNVVVSAMLASLREAIQVYTANVMSRLPSWESALARLRTEHEEILKAIGNGHAELASRLITEHIEGYYAQSTPENTPENTRQ